jgi:hypothetical protein
VAHTMSFHVARLRDRVVFSARLLGCGSRCGMLRIERKGVRGA